MSKSENIYKTLSYYKKVLEDKGYNVLYIGLYGSQNYNVDDEQSDIDAKAIIMPTLHDIIFRKVTSLVIECEQGSIDVKDLITFYSVIKKGNFSYVEAIDTKYSIGDKYIKKLFSQIRPNFKSMLGAMYEKRKALTHEYPSKKLEFEKWGCDPKQYHHIIRLYDLLYYNIKNKCTLSYIDYDEITSQYSKEDMISLKRNKYNLTKEDMEEVSDIIIEEAKGLLPKDYAYEFINLDYEINTYIEDKIKLEINNSPISYAREVRTFDTNIPKSDLKKFPILQQYQGKDISYIVFESIDIL